jgi:hypothetical protein
MKKHFTAGVICMITLLNVGITETQILLLQQEQQSAYARLPGFSAEKAEQRALAAPIAISGDDMYIAWWTNKTGNDEVMFRASDDGGATFADKINLSNSTNADSVDAEIAADFNNVVVSWWERNVTGDEPVARISNDNGVTFGPILTLSKNGTIGPGSDIKANIPRFYNSSSTA